MQYKLMCIDNEWLPKEVEEFGCGKRLKIDHLMCPMEIR